MKRMHTQLFMKGTAQLSFVCTSYTSLSDLEDPGLQHRPTHLKLHMRGDDCPEKTNKGLDYP